MTVNASLSSRVIPTYPVGTPDRNPLFFENRVYQGSSGKVYPIPFIDKVYDEPKPVEYKVAVLENEYVYLEMLPEIGGRLFTGRDKTNRNYDFIYPQEVIKPALVGLAGPWVSGGIEFNWPQHHRPGTYLPTSVWIEDEPDGSRTVWFSESDPISRLKGLHGIRLRPGSAAIEVRVRLHNRTAFTQTFLWWANLAARAHDQYQSFFPTDVHYVADHAVRAMSSFPIAENDYYGVDYAARPGANDLTWYKNIPVPTSYMVCETQFGFLGGYDFKARGGVVHFANRHISPGKKLWTWGDAPFGHAWDRELTDTGGPYVELMAGVYTDNQPDFSYLLPSEEKHFSQYWWPFQQTGPLQNANDRVGLRMVACEDGRLEIAAASPMDLGEVIVQLRRGEETVFSTRIPLSPASPWVHREIRLEGYDPSAFELSVLSPAGERLLSYRPPQVDSAIRHREVASEPPAPEVSSIDEMLHIAEHLEQYRHPTRSPEPYWEEVLRRDPRDSRAHLAVGRKRFKEGRFAEASESLRAAIGGLTKRHPNPETGEAHYYLGLALNALGKSDEAYEALYKATWNFAWRAPAYFELALIDSLRGEWRTAAEHAREASETNRRHHQAQVLHAILERRAGNHREAEDILRLVLERDAFDPWALWEEGSLHGSRDTFLARTRNDAQTVLDVAFDYMKGGLDDEAIELLEWHHAQGIVAVAVPNPLDRTLSTRYLLGFLLDRAGRKEASEKVLSTIEEMDPDYFFPSRTEEQRVLEWALDRRANDSVAAYGLGNLYYDRKRYTEAIQCWEQSVKGFRIIPTAWRNLGVAYWNVHRDDLRATKAYENALAADSGDARFVYEYDQLRKKAGLPVDVRLAFLEEHRTRVLERDDASIELATLLLDAHRTAEALELMSSRRFHPLEGGEGKVLAQYKRAHLALAANAMDAQQPEVALSHCEKALSPPENLGEVFHPLQSQAEVRFWRGLILQALGREKEARESFEHCIREAGDFKDMAVVAFSEASYYKGRSLAALGRDAEARAHFKKMIRYCEETRQSVPRIPYFATSLPHVLVFNEDLREARDRDLAAIQALAEKGLEELGD